ncbi:response regulator transcription factor [Actinoplanes sp. LDG1-06]|uniref:Response regulator transcription factor n=1 Tax=Paractinoplanes ovalisporus TaxID=2810368 RepID=A0ABS2AFF4_9ACTN|nr:response regulator transcription factor [Actinoplanes ovalisporus]MBM2618558.1 response regulator transcription factor [Actinoplanes ovalisporus]
MRILVADDERLYADLLAAGLRRHAMAVDVCYDGEAAIERLGVHRYDVAVLDRDMPGRTGDDVCRWVHEQRLETRVLLLTAAGSVYDRVEGLRLGADDYLTKPFAFAELVARMEALARRTAPALPPALERDGVTVDLATRTATRDGRPLGLTAKEFGLLHALLRAQGHAVTVEDLLEQVWDEHTDPFTNVVRVTVGNLRRKLGEPAVLHTVPRSGYRLGA